jgi:aspartyl-tRNA(Asn)/glutamyl-tRNA(Gln) amidotransferase subunit A
MTKSVEECAIALQIMAGHDEHDPTSSREPVPNYMSSLDSGVAGMRIGVPRAFFEKSPKLRDESRAAIESTIARLREEGAVVEDVELPVMAVFNACGRVLIAAEMYTVHRERLRTRIEEYEPRTVSRLLMGAAVTSADYLNALRLRAVLTASINEVLSSHEALLTAISLDTAPRHDAALTVRDWPLQMNMFNVTGHPAIVVPVGLSRAGLPLSVQLAGRPFEEDSLLRIARSVEKSSGWQDIQPPSWRATQPQAQVVQRT